MAKFNTPASFTNATVVGQDANSITIRMSLDPSGELTGAGNQKLSSSGGWAKISDGVTINFVIVGKAAKAAKAAPAPAPRNTAKPAPRNVANQRDVDDEMLEFPFHKYHKCQSYNQNSTRWLWNLGRRNRRRDWSVKNAARSRKPVPRCWKSVKRKFAGIRHSAISATQRLIHRRILYGWNGISYRKCRERNYDRSNLWARARRLPYAVSDCFSNYRHVVVPHSMNCSAAISPNLIKSHPNPLV